MRCEKCGYKIGGANHEGGKHHGQKHPGDKRKAKLALRQVDYDKNIAGNPDLTGYRRPGSLKHS